MVSPMATLALACEVFGTDGDTGIGVHGQANGPQGTGVFAQADKGTAVNAVSGTGIAVIGGISPGCFRCVRGRTCRCTIRRRPSRPRRRVYFRQQGAGALGPPVVRKTRCP